MAMLTEQQQLLVKISADASSAVKGFGQLKGSVDALGSTVAKVATLIGGAFALRDVINSTQAWANQLDNLHDTLGLSGDEAAKWNYQARLVGTTADDVATAFGQLTNKIGNSLPAIKKGEDDFSKWGIKVLDSNNNLLGAVDILDQVREKVAALGPGLGARQLEMDLFGRSGGKLHDFLSLSNDEIERMNKDLKALGLPTNVDELEAMNRESNRLGIIFDSIKIKLGSALLPVLLAVGRGLASLAGYVKVLGDALRYPLGIIKEVIDRFGKFITQIKDQGLVVSVSELAQDIASKIGEGLGNVRGWVSENWPKWKTALGDLWRNTVMFIEEKAPQFGKWITDSIPIWAANLAGLAASVATWVITDLIPGFASGLYTLHSKLTVWAGSVGLWMLTEALPRMFGAFVTVGASLAGAIFDALARRVRELFETIRLRIIPHVTLTGISFETLFDIAGALRDWLASHIGPGWQFRVPLPIGGTPPAGGPGVGIGTGPQPSAGATIGNWSQNMQRRIDLFAEGGIVTSPRLGIVGESGPEAIIPLDRAGSMGTTINVYVSGNITRSEKDLADMVSREIMRSLGNRRAVAF